MAGKTKDTPKREWCCEVCETVVLRLQPGSLVRKGTTFLCAECSGEGAPLDFDGDEKFSADDVEYLKNIFGMK